MSGVFTTEAYLEPRQISISTMETFYENNLQLKAKSFIADDGLGSKYASVLNTQI